MNHRLLTIALPALLLSACGGEEQTIQTDSSAQSASLTYAYPADGQTNVSPETDLVLRFSEPVPETEIEHILLQEGSGQPMDLSLERRVDDGRSIVLSAAALAPATHYTISFSRPLTTEGGSPIPTPNAVGSPGLQFTTRGDLGDVAALTNLDDTFQVAGMTPDDQSLDIVDFSTLRLRTTQPIHPESLIYGTTVSLTDSEGTLVPAKLLGKGNKLTIDPCTTEQPEDCGSASDQLSPEKTYTLTLDGVSNLEGETLTFETTFSPRETGPTEVLYQTIADGGQSSRLNGNIVNGVTLNSVLQGKAGPSQQSGALYAELAYSPNFGGEPVPLRVPRGTVLESTSLDVDINGSVSIRVADTQQPQTTGTIEVTMLSDASGYMLPNPYSDASDAPRHIRLWMDVAMNTEEAQPNAALSQSLMRVELTGIARVRDGILTIDAIGMVEPNLLGQENTNATIAFRLDADTGAQDDAPPRPSDSTGPELVSWMPGSKSAYPGDRQRMQRPGDPVILNFNEPIDPESVTDGLSLTAGGTTLADLRTRVDGTTVTLQPDGGLTHNGGPYGVVISNALTDLAGNPATSRNLSFSLAPKAQGTDVPERSPIALTTYPGYPCATTDHDLANNDHGYCVDKPFIDAHSDSDSDGDNNDAGDAKRPSGQPVDRLPVTTLPRDRSIVVVFSQSMDLSSIRLNDPDTPQNEGSFIVERVSEDKNVIDTVTGRLEKNRQRIRFHPDKPWVDGALYRYTLLSAGDGDCAQVICGANGKALQTDALTNPEDVGGRPLTIYFRGADARQSVFTPLRNLPVRDSNANYVIDCGDSDCAEPFNHVPNGSSGFKPSANAARLSVVGGTYESDILATNRARVGCEPTESTGGPVAPECPKEKFIYQTYGLNTEVIGPVDPDNPGKGVRVLLYPTRLLTTSLDVFLEGTGVQPTGPQVLRMRYAKTNPDCTSDCKRDRLIPGTIMTNDQGQAVFKAEAELLLDAPNLQASLGGSPLPEEGYRHNLYGYPLALELEGAITFFDDGRMQIEQRNQNDQPVQAKVNLTNDEGALLANIPLIIPANGLFLNFVSNPIKNLPVSP